MRKGRERKRRECDEAGQRDLPEKPADWERLSLDQRLQALERIRSSFDRWSGADACLETLERRFLSQDAALELAEAKGVLRILEHLECTRPDLELRLLETLRHPGPLLGQKLGVLGACGGEASLRELQHFDASGELAQSSAFVQNQWRKAMGRLRRRLAIPSTLQLHNIPWARSVRWILTCVPGMEDALASEVQATVPSALVVQSQEAMSGEVWVQPVRGGFGFETLQQLRLFSDARMVIEAPLKGVFNTKSSPLDAVIPKLATCALSQIPEACTRSSIRFALRTSGVERPSGTRLAQAARLLETSLNARSSRTDRWINDPRDEDWTFHLHWIAPDQVRLELQVHAKHWDKRFAYRIADLPAASHPTIAALLASQALGFLSNRAQVLDPFCGSALELIELGRIRPDLMLLAGDCSAEALEVARTLTDRAKVELKQRVLLDALRWKFDQELDAVVTNPPFGRRATSDDIVALLQSFLERVPSWLKPGGVLVWISPQPRRTAAVLERNGMRMLRQQPLDLGGIRVALQIAQKSQASH